VELVTGTPAHDTEPPLEALLDRSLGWELQKEFAPYLPALVEDLAEIDARLAEVLHSAYPQLEEAAQYACRSGGKRLRPLLMAIAARSLGQESTRRIHSLAAAFQLIHTATLVHDDVIDHAELRRGRPSVVRAFGLPAAIVAGDYLFVRAFELAAEYPRSVILRCGEACADLAEGEVLQETARFDVSAGRAHYARVIERKTAAIVAAALSSVAEILGSPAPTVDAFAEYGRSVGMAYQIRDDLLDINGDPDLLGKPLYSDLREGNPTLVTLEAHDRLAGSERQEFERLFSLRRKQPADLLRLRELVDRTDAVGRVEAIANQWRQRAVEALRPVPVGPYRSLLEHAAFLAAARPY
jgi:octaprenyl-diphosphate synthase